jgi:hypothetical protein
VHLERRRQGPENGSFSSIERVVLGAGDVLVFVGMSSKGSWGWLRGLVMLGCVCTGGWDWDWDCVV